MSPSTKSVAIKSHPRVESLRERTLINRSRHNSFFSNSDSLISEESSSDEHLEDPSCSIIVLTAASVVIAVLSLTLLGTLIFVLIGKNERRAAELPECLETARRWAMGRANESIGDEKEVHSLLLQTLTVAKECDEDNKMILTTSDAAVFSWSLYSTVGYGDMFMHSGLGRAITIVYSFFASALYLAVKAEVGTIIARNLSDFIAFVRRTSRRIRCLKSRDPIPPPLRPLARFLICALLFFVAMMVMTVYMKISEGSNWSWGTSFYFAYITMALIGLGDVVPTDKITFIICAQPLLLVGDTLFAQMNWYMQDRLRFGFHFLLRKCQCERMKRAKGGENTGNSITGEEYPTVTSKMIPMVPSDDESLAIKNAKKKRRASRMGQVGSSKETAFGSSDRAQLVPLTLLPAAKVKENSVHALVGKDDPTRSRATELSATQTDPKADEIKTAKYPDLLA